MSYWIYYKHKSIMAPPWFKKIFKHNFFFLDCVLIDPSNVASASTKLDVVIDLTQANENLTKARKKKNLLIELSIPRLMGYVTSLGKNCCGC
jgi:hypothetical protein